MFIFQKILNEGTSEPFFARMMLQIMEIRDFIMPGPLHEKDRLEFDKYYEPVLNNLIECRHAKLNCEKLIEEHSKKMETGEIVVSQGRAYEIKESIDIDLNRNFKDFFMKGEVSLQCLNKLCKYWGYPISFFFQNDKDFEKKSEKFISINKGEKYEHFVDMLKKDRISWYLFFNEVRNKIEHEGFNLPKILYKINQDGKMMAYFPTINDRPLLEILNNFWNNLFEFSEDVFIFLFSFKLPPITEIGVIPENERDPKCPKKYRVVLKPNIGIGNKI